MTPREFEKHHLRRPFNPFTLHLDDGMHYDVPTPEYAAHAPGARHCIVIDMRGSGHAVIDLDHVSRITFPEPALTTDAQEAV
jgi:hypothetical protein